MRSYTACGAELLAVAGGAVVPAVDDRRHLDAPPQPHRGRFPMDMDVIGFGP